MREALIKIKDGLIWFLKSFIWITLVVILIDQTTKLVFQETLGPYSETGKDLAIFSDKFINIRVTYNLGAAWSILRDHHWLLALISVLASIAIIVYLIYKYKKLDVYERICIFLILGGCMGNMIDRVFYPKGVIDFISLGFMDFPTFNIADSALCVGVFLLFIKIIIDEIKGKNSDEKNSQNNK